MKMLSSNIKVLKPCPMCDKNEVVSTYKENARYRYKCNHCGQYFEFNAPSQLSADFIFNEVICGGFHPTEKGGAE